MKKGIYDNRHTLSRVIVFSLLVIITVGVFLVLGSSASRQALQSIHYRFKAIEGSLKERLHSYSDTLLGKQTLPNTQSIPVLLYHGIGNDNSIYTLSQDQFREQMVALKSAGYHTISADTFIAYMKGQITLPQKSILITFDDGRKDSYYGADPILAKLNFRAVMFIAVEQSLSPQADSSNYYVNTQEIKQMIASGRWDIDSHAMQATGGFIPIDTAGKQGYFLSNKKWLSDKGRLETDEEYQTRVAYELTESKKEIETLTGKENMLFAYPFGDYGNQSTNNLEHAERVIETDIAQNYSYAFRQLRRPDNGFSANSRADNPYLLDRIEMRKDIPTSHLLDVLASSIDLAFKPHTISGSELSDAHNRWHSVWGNGPTMTDSAMTITTDAAHPSSITTLDGTRNWTDYQFSIHIPDQYHDTVALFARMSDPSTTGVRCTWSGDKVSIQEAADTTSSAKHSYNVGHALTANTTLGIAVNGNAIGCYENNEIVASLMMSQTQAVGGIGIETWSDDKGPSVLTIDAYSFANADISESQVAFLQKLSTKSLVQPTTTAQLAKDISSFAVSARYATGINMLSTDPNAFEQNPYGAVVATYGTDKNTYTITVGDIRPNTSSGADYLWPPQGVRSGQEYAIEGSYAATTISELGAKFVTDDGHVTWVDIKDMPPVKSPTPFHYVVTVPPGATMMHLYQTVQSVGSVTTLSPKLFLLKDGAFDQPMITLNFDDGRKTFIENAFPLLEQYHMVASIPTITSATGWSGYMSPLDLYKAWQAGDEITAHTRDHIHLTANLSDSSLINQIIGSWYDLHAIGFPTDTFVYPYGDFSPQAELIASQRYIGARSVIRGFNTRNTDPYALQDQLVDSTITQQQLQDWITTAQQTHTWLILELHNINPPIVKTDVEGITIDQLNMVLQTIQNSGIKVVTLHDGLEVLRSR